jgi:F-type H+-transporting ATPase subunit b
LKELGLDLGLFVSQAVNFLLFALLLSMALVKPVMRQLEQRAERIKKGLQDAEEAERMVRLAEAQAQKLVDEARHQAREIVETATRSAEQQRQEILANARQEAYELQQRAHEQLAREEAELQFELRDEMIAVSLAAASRLLEAELDDEHHRRLVQQFLDEARKLPVERT